MFCSVLFFCIFDISQQISHFLTLLKPLAFIGIYILLSPISLFLNGVFFHFLIGENVRCSLSPLFSWQCFPCVALSSFLWASIHVETSFILSTCRCLFQLYFFALSLYIYIDIHLLPLSFLYDSVECADKLQQSVCLRSYEKLFVAIVSSSSVYSVGGGDVGLVYAELCVSSLGGHFVCVYFADLSFFCFDCSFCMLNSVQQSICFKREWLCDFLDFR